MKTTVEISDELFLQTKKYASEAKITIREVLEHSLRSYLDFKNNEEMYRLPDLSYGKSGVHPGIELGNWNEMRSLIYGER